MSFFILNLDTTAPELEIYAPVYTSNNNTVEINIESNEELDDWQEVYTVDEMGVRRDYTFYIEGNTMIGVINPYNYPVGLFFLYIKVRDSVHNETRLYEEVITIRDTNAVINLEVRDFKLYDLDINNRSKKIEVNSSTKDIDVRDSEDYG